MSASESQAAAFVVAFRRASEMFSLAGPMNPLQHEAWKQLYAVVASNEAGLDLLSELAKLREQVKQQEGQVTNG